MLGGLDMMHRRHGRLPWARVCTEAVRLARDGFGATPHYRQFAADQLTDMRPHERTAAAFLREGEAPLVGPLSPSPIWPAPSKRSPEGGLRRSTAGPSPAG